MKTKFEQVFISHHASDHMDCMADLAATRPIRMSYGLEDDLQQGSFAKTTVILHVTSLSCSEEEGVKALFTRLTQREKMLLTPHPERRRVATATHEAAHAQLPTETWERRAASLLADIFLSPEAREEWLGDLDENRRDVISRGRPRWVIILATLRVCLQMGWAFFSIKYQDLISPKKERQTK